MNRVLHLSEEEATDMAAAWACVLPDGDKSHEYAPLWSLIQQIEETFGLKWHEDVKAFERVTE